VLEINRINRFHPQHDKEKGSARSLTLFWLSCDDQNIQNIYSVMFCTGVKHVLCIFGKNIVRTVLKENTQVDK
jgi:hypothetical protein